jgi:hypothetical protein
MQAASTPPPQTGPLRQPPAFDASFAAYLRKLEGRNRGPAPLSAYPADLTKLFVWLGETNTAATAPAPAERAGVQGPYGAPGPSRAVSLLTSAAGGRPPNSSGPSTRIVSSSNRIVNGSDSTSKASPPTGTNR